MIKCRFILALFPFIFLIKNFHFLFFKYSAKPSNEQSHLSNSLGLFETFLESIQMRNLISHSLEPTTQTSTGKMRNYTSLETILEKQQQTRNQSGSQSNSISSGSSSPLSRSTTLSRRVQAFKPISPIISHYSASIYVYLYIFDYFNQLFEQFKSKRDHFQISEKLLLELHYAILDGKSGESGDRFVERINQLDRDQLFGKFEEYAECVHKYLPQIRQHNQYLLFHYIWTMQVQYLAPFFNHLCDSYESFN